MIVSSNMTVSAWAEICGYPVAVAAMVDRLVHHAEVSSSRVTATGCGARGGGADGLLAQLKLLRFRPAISAQVGPALTFAHPADRTL
jgi:hypothetical protein